MSPVPVPSTFRDRKAANPAITDAELLNSGNSSATPATDSDVTVVGAGIHGLLYSIGTRFRWPDAPIKLSVFEKATRPQWKIGESTLPYFAAWTNTVGLKPEYLLRIFTLHDGLEFYTLDRENQPEYTDFCSGGPPPNLNIAYQLQRAMSELVFTIFAQRNGIDVWHGHAADVQNTVVSAEGDVIPIKNVDSNQEIVTKSPLLVDATGRFRQFASKAARVKRFEDGFNQDAYWAYFVSDREDEIPNELRGFEAGHTNHVCFPEGWMYLIRMISWDGSPLPNLIDMVNYVLDHAAAGTPHDEVPSTAELAKMFGLTYRFIWSIGYATRSDTTWPADLTPYGSNEAERRFNFITQKYQKLTAVMKLFTRLEDHYGSDFEKWQIRKQLNYQSAVVSGPGWITIGDGLGFTNPLLSPGINTGIASDALASELTYKVLKAKNEEEKRVIWKKYDDFAASAIPSLHKMNQFLYLCLLHPTLGGRIAFMWALMAGHAKDKYAIARIGFNVEIERYSEFAENWHWGAQTEDYVSIANKVIEVLGKNHVDQRPTDAQVKEIVDHSEMLRKAAVEANRYLGFPFRFDAWFRNFGPQIEYDPEKYPYADSIAAQCHNCKTWNPRRADWRICANCGVDRPQSEYEIQYTPPLPAEYLLGFATVAPLESFNEDQRAFLVAHRAAEQLKHKLLTPTNYTGATPDPLPPMMMVWPPPPKPHTMVAPAAPYYTTPAAQE
ncbi:hypothetical protein DL93DRAFT_2164544 [Clavulina sp. PMI_390]|nr:hypothetical protein DL93DRAFT_2164544 [Clavulina sp. PMI_390]